MEGHFAQGNAMTTVRERLKMFDAVVRDINTKQTKLFETL